MVKIADSEIRHGEEQESCSHAKDSWPWQAQQALGAAQQALVHADKSGLELELQAKVEEAESLRVQVRVSGCSVVSGCSC